MVPAAEEPGRHCFFSSQQAAHWAANMYADRQELQYFQLFSIRRGGRRAISFDHQYRCQYCLHDNTQLILKCSVFTVSGHLPARSGLQAHTIDGLTCHVECSRLAVKATSLQPENSTSTCPTEVTMFRTRVTRYQPPRKLLMTGCDGGDSG